MTLPECLRVRRVGAWIELLDADVIVLVVCVAWPSENERRKWERADLDRMEKECGGCVHLTIAQVFSVARLAGADSALGINKHEGYMEETVSNGTGARKVAVGYNARGFPREPEQEWSGRASRAAGWCASSLRLAFFSPSTNVVHSLVSRSLLYTPPDL
jgi:hypothetical protein